MAAEPADTATVPGTLERLEAREISTEVQNRVTPQEVMMAQRQIVRSGTQQDLDEEKEAGRAVGSEKRGGRGQSSPGARASEGCMIGGLMLTGTGF